MDPRQRTLVPGALAAGRAPGSAKRKTRARAPVTAAALFRCSRIRTSEATAPHYVKRFGCPDSALGCLLGLFFNCFSLHSCWELGVGRQKCWSLPF